VTQTHGQRSFSTSLSAFFYFLPYLRKRKKSDGERDCTK
jgi:hypothetical protein